MNGNKYESPLSLEPYEFSRLIAGTNRCFTPRAADPDLADRLLVVQPHSDDAALSAFGLIYRWAGSVDIVTVFEDPAHPSERQKEDEQFALLVHASSSHMGLMQTSRTDPNRDSERRSLGAEAQFVNRVRSGGTLLGPLAVGSHPDHSSVRRILEASGCFVYWEDVAFWSIYGAAVEDRVAFSLRHPGLLSRMVVVLFDLSSMVPELLAGLDCYSSQSSDVWRPIRYFAAIAAEHGTHGFRQRIFVNASSLERFIREFRVNVEYLGKFTYGLDSLKVYVAVQP